jgi:hypothetical protein
MQEERQHGSDAEKSDDDQSQKSSLHSDSLKDVPGNVLS